MINLKLEWDKMSQWLIERFNIMFHVDNGKPDGSIKNKFWVETREWDKDLWSKVEDHYKKTSGKYIHHK